MKKYISAAIVLLSVIVVVLSCKKNTLSVAPFEVIDNQKALFKLNYASPYAKNPAVQIKVDGERVSNNITYATPFPGGGLNTGGSSNADYLAFSPGSHTVSIGIPKVGTGEDSIVLFNTNVTLDGGIYHTLHVTDTTTNTQGILYTDAQSKPDSGYSSFRFVNLIPGSAIDLYFGPNKLASNIAYKAASDTFKIAAATAYQFAIRLAGSAPASTALATYPISGTTTYSIPNQRAFTAYARGYLSLPAADVRRAHLSFVYNK
jgi:hypothetical protein